MPAGRRTVLPFAEKARSTLPKRVPYTACTPEKPGIVRTSTVSPLGSRRSSKAVACSTARSAPVMRRRPLS